MSKTLWDKYNEATAASTAAREDLNEAYAKFCRECRRFEESRRVEFIKTYGVTPELLLANHLVDEDDFDFDDLDDDEENVIEEQKRARKKKS